MFFSGFSGLILPLFKKKKYKEILIMTLVDPFEKKMTLASKIGFLHASIS